MIKDSDVLNQIFYDKLINKINKNGYEIKTLQEARALTENFTGGGWHKAPKTQWWLGGKKYIFQLS
jgi:hypothetical protein